MSPKNKGADPDGRHDHVHTHEPIRHAHRHCPDIRRCHIHK